MAGTWASCLGCRQLAVWLRGRALGEHSAALLCFLPYNRDPANQGKCSGPYGSAGSPQEGASVLRSKPPSPSLSEASLRNRRLPQSKPPDLPKEEGLRGHRRDSPTSRMVLATHPCSAGMVQAWRDRRQTCSAIYQLCDLGLIIYLSVQHGDNDT